MKQQQQRTSLRAAAGPRFRLPLLVNILPLQPLLFNSLLLLGSSCVVQFFLPSAVEVSASHVRRRSREADYSLSETSEEDSEQEEDYSSSGSEDDGEYYRQVVRAISSRDIGRQPLSLVLTRRNLQPGVVLPGAQQLAPSPPSSSSSSGLVSSVPEDHYYSDGSGPVRSVPEDHYSEGGEQRSTDRSESELYTGSTSSEEGRSRSRSKSFSSTTSRDRSHRRGRGRSGSGSRASSRRARSASSGRRYTSRQRGDEIRKSKSAPRTTSTPAAPAMIVSAPGTMILQGTTQDQYQQPHTGPGHQVLGFPDNLNFFPVQVSKFLTKNENKEFCNGLNGVDGGAFLQRKLSHEQEIEVNYGLVRHLVQIQHDPFGALLGAHRAEEFLRNEEKAIANNYYNAQAAHLFRFLRDRDLVRGQGNPRQSGGHRNTARKKIMKRIRARYTSLLENVRNQWEWRLLESSKNNNSRRSTRVELLQRFRSRERNLQHRHARCLHKDNPGGRTKYSSWWFQSQKFSHARTVQELIMSEVANPADEGDRIRFKEDNMLWLPAFLLPRISHAAWTDMLLPGPRQEDAARWSPTLGTTSTTPLGEDHFYQGTTKTSEYDAFCAQLFDAFSAHKQHDEEQEKLLADAFASSLTLSPASYPAWSSAHQEIRTPQSSSTWRSGFVGTGAAASSTAGAGPRNNNSTAPQHAGVQHNLNPQEHQEVEQVLPTVLQFCRSKNKFTTRTTPRQQQDDKLALVENKAKKHLAKRLRHYNSPMDPQLLWVHLKDEYKFQLAALYDSQPVVLQDFFFTALTSLKVAAAPGGPDDRPDLSSFHFLEQIRELLSLEDENSWTVQAQIFDVDYSSEEPIAEQTIELQDVVVREDLFSIQQDHEQKFMPGRAKKSMPLKKLNESKSRDALLLLLQSHVASSTFFPNGDEWAVRHGENSDKIFVVGEFDSELTIDQEVSPAPPRVLRRGESRGRTIRRNFQVGYEFRVEEYVPLPGSFFDKPEREEDFYHGETRRTVPLKGPPPPSSLPASSSRQHQEPAILSNRLRFENRLKKEEAAAQSIANRTKFAAMHFTLTLVDWKDLANAGFDIRSWTNADFDFDRRRRGGHSSNARWDDETGGVHRGKKIFDGWTVIGSDEYDYDQRRRNLPHGPRLYFRLVFKPPAGN
ncbi:unnamed protein product [Amoebophrya sp. A120]|nr:unnamed protein product [Amoebophrya sp. A120]|eukprot:GSA120T00009775001.1